MDRWVFAAAMLLVLLAVLLAIGRWGWRYGAHAPTTKGLSARVALLVCLASWSVAVAISHGVGVFPVPALACLYIAQLPKMTCFPEWWVMPLLTATAFLGPAAIAREKVKNRRG